MATHDVKLGVGLETGMFFHAPAGTSLPAYPLEPLSSEWKEVGNVSADGISLTFDRSVEDLKNWAKTVKRSIMTEHAESVSVTIMDTTQEVLETILGEGSTTVTAPTAAHGTVVTASLSKGELPPEEAYLFLMKDDDDVIAIGCTKGQITEMAEVTFSPEAAINWNPTIKGLDDGWQILLDDGQAES